MNTDPVYTCRQYRLLIAGSRQANKTLLTKAFQAVERAKTNGWAVLVGDAEGVDSAVIAACNKLGVNYVCFGINAQPRSADYLDYKKGGTGRYIRVVTQKPYDYAARDRTMADLADRGLCLWNGASKGTAAVHEYLTSLGKPADLLNVRTKEPLPRRQRTPPAKTAPKPTLIEIIIDTATADNDSKGVIGLRALGVDGSLLYQARQVVEHMPTTTADYAKLTTLIHALERLKRNLKGDSAAYSLRVIQASKNVEGWLGKGWKRNTASVQHLGGMADDLLKCFPSVEWTKTPRAQIESILSKIS